MTTPENRRRHPRLTRHERLFVVLVAAGQGDELARQTVYCSTEDLSESGLRVRLQRPLPAEAQVDLWLKIEDAPGTFLLAAKVRWQREVGPGEYLLGLELEDRLGTDNERWRALVRDFLAAGPATGP